MIVISNSLVLAQVDAVQGTPWIGYQNVSSTITATQELAGFPAAQLADPATNKLWKGTSAAASEYVTFGSIGFPGELDYLGIARHNFGSTGCILSVEGRSATNSPPTGWFELVQQQIVPDDTPILFRWTPQVLTDVRLRIVAPAPGTTMQAAVMYVGKLLVMERGLDISNDHVPIKYGRVTNIVSGMSETGNFLGRIVIGEHRESKAEFKHITPTFYRSDVDPFIVTSKLIPFFWVWNPSEYPYEVGYVWLINEPVPATSPITRRVSIELQMRGVA